MNLLTENLLYDCLTDMYLKIGWFLLSTVVPFIYNNAEHLAEATLFGLVCYLTTYLVLNVYWFFKFLLYPVFFVYRVLAFLWRIAPSPPTFFLPEAVMPNSPFYRIDPAPCTVKVLSKGRVVCHGFRLKDLIVLPEHGTSSDGLLLADLDGHHVALDSITLLPLVTDVVCFKMPTELTAKALRCSPLLDSMSVLAGTVKNTGSLGRAKPFGFEMYTYDGATIPGMSGLPLIQNGFVVGMHLGSTASTNVGVTAAYLELKLKELFYKPESSDYAFLNKLSRAELKELLLRETGDPDEVEANYGGRYFRLSRSEARRLREQEEREVDALVNAFEGDNWTTNIENTNSLRGELRELRLQLEALEVDDDSDQEDDSVESKRAPTAPSVDRDPLPEYDFPENCYRPLDGHLYPGGALIQLQQRAMPEPTPSVSPKSPSTNGPKQTPPQYERPLKSIRLSAKRLRTKKNRQQKMSEIYSRLGSVLGISIESDPPSQTSTPKKGKRTSKSASSHSTLPQDLASACLALVQQLDKRLAGMELNVKTSKTSSSSEPASKESCVNSSKDPLPTTSGSS
uniref:Serine protease n=1 Tax=Zootermopsis nevadensis sobeli-like virus 3 TaxID=3133524 RepID=A0AAT9JNU4_9VIRU